MKESENAHDPSAPGGAANDPFGQTRWTVVRNAQSGSREALEELFTTYREPIVRHLKRHLGQEDGEDACQDYLLGLLKSGYLDKAAQEHGKFRAFLLHDLRFFILGRRRKRSAAKRGGTTPQVSYEAAIDAGVQIEDQGADWEVEAFDQDWAAALLDQARQELRRQHEGPDRQERFEVMEPFIEAGGESTDFEEAAARLSMSVNAFTTAVTRLRHRYAATLRAQVEQSLSPGESIDEELAYLSQCYQRSKSQAQT